MRRSELIQGVVSWNNRFPLDRWWRIKHNVSFMSPEHRESSFIYQLLEFEEDKLYLKEFQAEHEKNKDKYIPGIGDIFKAPTTIEDFSTEAEREIEEMLKLEQNGGRQENTGIGCCATASGTHTERPSLVERLQQNGKRVQKHR